MPAMIKRPRTEKPPAVTVSVRPDDPRTHIDEADVIRRLRDIIDSAGPGLAESREREHHYKTRLAQIKEARDANRITASAAEAQRQQAKDALRPFDGSRRRDALIRARDMLPELRAVNDRIGERFITLAGFRERGCMTPTLADEWDDIQLLRADIYDTLRSANNAGEELLTVCAPAGLLSRFKELGTLRDWARRAPGASGPAGELVRALCEKIGNAHERMTEVLLTATSGELNDKIKGIWE